MPTPATADSLLHLLDRSGLLPADTTAAYRTAGADPRGLAERLLRDRLLTPFQARQLLAGRYRGFFLTAKYKVLDLIGEGGMGRVLLCEHLILHRLLAAKVLTGAGEIPGAVERFLREARALAALDHPNIARVFDVDQTPAGPFLVMEFVDGTNLHHLVAQHGPLPPGRAAGACLQAALGLQHAHEAGLVHRDVKPGNLMLDRTGGVKLLDLGLARFFDPRRNQNLTSRFDAKNVLGTADFIAPEQAANSSAADIRADIYSLGCTLYYLLAGRFPFPDGEPLAKLVKHQTQPFDPVRAHAPGVPAGLAAVLDRMVMKDPADRYQTPAAAAAALEEWADPPAPPPPHEMPRNRASHYLLGLSPPPGPDLLAAAGPASPVVRPLSDSVGRPPSDAPLFGLADTPPHTAVTAVGLSAERMTVADSGRPAAAPAAPPGRRWWPWAALLVGLIGLGVGGWPLVRPAGRPGPPPPAPADSPPLVVAGSTFIRPLMDHWAELYARATGRRVEYRPLGSPRGVTQMAEQVVPVGLTDVPLTDDQLRAADKVGGKVLHVPLALGAVAVTYTLPDAGPDPVRLGGPVLAEIYRGKLRSWDDEGIAVSNPGRRLPRLPVVPVRRQDGSGTTALFTGFLRGQVADWPAAAAGTDPAWPAPGPAAKGSDAVAAEVGRTAGAVGYVEMTFALTRRLAVAAVVNRDGRAVSPSVRTVAAAAAGLDPPADLRFNLLDRPGADSYPLSGATWAVLYADQPDGRAADVAGFLRWCVTAGQAHCGDLHYAPLPAPLAARAAAVLDGVK